MFHQNEVSIPGHEPDVKNAFAHSHRSQMTTSEMVI
jgi:hypothetical protein